MKRKTKKCICSANNRDMMSAALPSGKGTTILIVLIVWDHAASPVRRTAKMSAAAPAARCRNRRWGSFMAFLPGMQRHSESDVF